MTFPLFTEFFEACTATDDGADPERRGFQPLPWQQRLAEQAIRGDWPDRIDIPTGLGKSMTLLIAVYATAYQSHHGLPRTTPMRIVHVVDRRPIIDQVSVSVRDALNRIAQAHTLKSADHRRALEPVNAILGCLAAAWRATDDADPGGNVAAQGIHGASPDTRDWLRPTGVSIVSMTPHQLVSRLLFRGYGVSSRTRSIHAGLLGVDCLIVFDEPHLSEQAISTVRTVLAMQSNAPASLGIPPSRLVLLGATIRNESSDPEVAHEPSSEVTLTDGDFDDRETAKLLHAKRPLTLVEAGTGDPAVRAALLAAYKKQRAANPSAGIAIIVNTVALAQEVHRSVAALEEPSPVLLTSRMRAIDRRDAIAGATADGEGRVVIATQSLEVGVDLSFDIMITEACPYPSLVQRVGRLNRRGNSTNSAGIVVIGKEPSAMRKATEAIYGTTAVAATNAMLREIANSVASGIVDMSLMAQMERKRGNAVDPACWPDTPRQATFHAGYTEVMTATYPTPWSDLPVASLITGPDETSLDVLVAWRDSLALLQECKIHPDEQVSVPLPTLRAMLTHDTPPDISDLDYDLAPEKPAGRLAPDINQVRVYRDGDWQTIARVSEIQPGDQVALHRSLGGYRDRIGLSPQSSQEVSDLSLAVALTAAGPWQRPFPLSEATLNGWARRRTDADVRPLVKCIERVLTQFEDLEYDDIIEMLSEAAPPGLDIAGWEISKREPSKEDGERGKIEPSLVARRRVIAVTNARVGPQSLDAHQKQARDIALGTCAAVGITEEHLRWDIATAARHHDDGKDYDLFQVVLGNVGGADGPQGLWGKSASYANDRRNLAAARALGYPRGWLHEGRSAWHGALAGFCPLPVHLIGAHGGQFRPFLFSPVDRADQREIPGRAADFAHLNETWGPWGLAYLEAVVRLSDWRASALAARGIAIPASTPSAVPPTACCGNAAPLSSDQLDDALRHSGSRVMRHARARVEEDTDPAPVVPLPGLSESPVTGWFAVAGLLRAVREVDPDAAVRWPVVESSPPSAPEWRSRISLVDACRAMAQSRQWDEGLQKLGERLDGSFSAKNQKVKPLGELSEILRDILRDAVDRDIWLTLGILQDARAADGASMPLTVPAFANNASYIKVALAALASLSPEAIAEAFIDPDSGWDVSQCDGGMDRRGSDDGVTGSEISGKRKIRTALAPAALLGFASMGTVGIRGLGVRRGQLMLPLPADFVTLGELAAHTHGVTMSPHWALELTSRKATAYESLWAGRAVPPNTGASRHPYAGEATRSD